MLQDGADHFRAAVELMALGMSVLLFTDLSETFVMDTDAEIEDMLRLGWLRAEEPQSYCLLKLNPLVNRVLACLKEPVELKVTDRVYSVIRQARSETHVKTPEELGVLGLLRDPANRKVTVHFKDGHIQRAEAEVERPVETSKEDIVNLRSSSKRASRRRPQTGPFSNSSSNTAVRTVARSRCWRSTTSLALPETASTMRCCARSS
jgi:hypothetical protein